VIIGFFSTVAYLGTKPFMRVVGVLFIVGIVGLFVSLFALLSFHGNFASVFDNFAQPYTNNTDAYNHVIQATQASGYHVTGYSLSATLGSIPINMTWLAFAYWSSYNVGEFKKASDVKRQYWSMAIILIFNAVLTAGILFVLETKIGHEFFASMSYAFFALPDALPLGVQPSLPLFAGIMSGNSIVAFISAIGPIAIALSLTAILYPMLTRVMFAWSFDRLIPSAFANVSQRFGTPYVGIIFIAVVGFGSLLFNSYVAPSLYTYLTLSTVYVQMAFDFTIVGIAAIVFVTRKKDVYNASPAKRYHPLLLITGIGTTVLFGFLGVEYFTNPLYGIVTTNWIFAYSILIFIVPLLAYFLIKSYRKSKGIDLKLLFSEIPPE
jgi:amino acid transporter